VNISAIIEDNYKLYGAWVDITDPNDNPAGNVSMSYDSISGRFYIDLPYDIIGMYQFIIWTNDTSNNWNSSFGQFEIHDTILPEISDTTALPDPQEVEGFIDISAIIEDNYELNEVWINITDPNDNPAGNFSMNYDSGTTRYHDYRTFDIVGTYQFIIWANDTSGNWNYSIGQLQIHDTTSPDISDTDALPNPQEVEGYVNISAVVTDIVGVDNVWIEITDPNDDLVGNFSMNYDSLTNRYYDNRVYDIVGTYQFIIWASDTSDNWESGSDQFIIQDNQAPMADAGLDHAVIEGTTVTFDGTASTDNVGIVDYTWTFTDGTLQTLHESSPIYIFNNVGNFEILLSVSDAQDNEDTDTIWVNVSMVPDTIEPTITHTPKDSGTAGELLSITAVITDNIDVIDASLFYRIGSETEYTEVAMTNTVDYEWTADIPASDMTTEGIEYYIFATDGVNDVTEPPGNPYSINVKDEGVEEEDFPFLILLIVIIIIVSLLLIMLFLMKKKGKGEPTREEPVMVEAVELP
jgi:hypothetical protein